MTHLAEIAPRSAAAITPLALLLFERYVVEEVPMAALRVTDRSLAAFFAA